MERLSPTGITRWSRSFDFNSPLDGGVGLTLLRDGSLLSTVWSANPGRRQLYLLRTDANGQELWRRPYGWASPLGTEAISHTQTSPTGRILTAGFSRTGPAPAQLKLLVFNQRGDSVRGRLLAPLGPNADVRTQDIRNSLLPLADGGWLLTGYRDTVAGPFPDQPFLLRLDSLLQPQWVRRYRAPANADVVYGGTCELQDGSLLVLAWQRQPLTPSFALHRYSAGGQLLTIYPLPSTVAGVAVAPYLLAPAPDGRTLYVAGFCQPTFGSQQSYVAIIDLQNLPGAVVLSAPRPAQPATAATPLTFALFPNPASTTATVRYRLPAGTTTAALHLTDATGRLVRRLVLGGGSGGAEVTVPLAGLAPGLYAATLLAADGRPLATRRLAVAAL